MDGYCEKSGENCPLKTEPAEACSITEFEETYCITAPIGLLVKTFIGDVSINYNFTYSGEFKCLSKSAKNNIIVVCNAKTQVIMKLKNSLDISWKMLSYETFRWKNLKDLNNTHNLMTKWFSENLLVGMAHLNLTSYDTAIEKLSNLSNPVSFELFKNPLNFFKNIFGDVFSYIASFFDILKYGLIILISLAVIYILSFLRSYIPGKLFRFIFSSLKYFVPMLLYYGYEIWLTYA